MKQKDNENPLDHSKCLKQNKDMLKVHVGKDIMGRYVDMRGDFKNVRGASDKKRIKYEDFNKWMACLLIANLCQFKYSCLENGLTSQYSMKNNQYTST